jgi:hypothetical protein
MAAKLHVKYMQFEPPHRETSAATKAYVDAAIGGTVENDTTPVLGGELDAASFKIVNLGTPTENTNAATKAYVDAQIGATNEVVEDLTPQLGGPLDVNGNAIVSAAGGDITIDPEGAGKINLTGPVVFGGNLDVSARSITTTADGTLSIEAAGNSDLIITVGTGKFKINGLPVADPVVAGQLYVGVGGVLTVSAG